MTVSGSLANANGESTARVIAASAIGSLRLRASLRRCGWLLLSIVVVAGCRQQTTPGDPFLPFMRSRVPPPGTTVPPGGVAVDPYYNGTSGTAAAAGGTPAAPVVTPAAPAAVDKYSPRGGFNVPQGSIERVKTIDRSKAIDFAKANEVKASPTAIARRSLSTPLGGRTQVDTQLTSAKTVAPAVADGSAPFVSTRSLSTPDVSPMAALTPLTDSAPADSALADVSVDDGAIDSVVANFDGNARPSAAVPAQTQWTEPSQNALTAARSKTARIAATEPAKRTTIRIRTAAEDAFADDEEQVASTPAGSDTRLRMTAGGSRADVNSKPIEEESQQEVAVAAADARPGVHFTASEPDAGAAHALWLEPADGAADRVATVAATAVASASDPYRYEPSYASLSGRLEYSASARQWKLRYIPIDGTTDQFGGSVLLADSAKLEGFKPGDFVSVRGTIAAASQNARGFSPRYELAQIEPIR